MNRFSDVKIVEEFENNGTKYGIYWANFKNKHYLFIRNGNSVGVVTHIFGKKANDCVSIIRDDVCKELFEILTSKDKTE